MKLSTETKLIVDKEDNYMELGAGDLVNITLNNGDIIVATIIDINSDNLFISDDECDDDEETTLTVMFNDIEDIEEG